MFGAPAEAEAFVAARVAEGSDYLKIVIGDGTTAGTSLPGLDRATAAVLVGEAHGAGLWVVAHAATAAEAAAALDAGADRLAHVWWAARPGDPSTEEPAARAAAQGTFVVTTLAHAEVLDAGRKTLLPQAEQVAATLHAAGAPSSPTPTPPPSPGRVGQDS
ncbi:hypothetical protein ACWDUX_05015 [Streptomyces sp. NPDC003444]